MESSVVFSHSRPPVDPRDDASAAIPVQAPLFSDVPDSQSLAGPTTS
jgi:hypothetical protein